MYGILDTELELTRHDRLKLLTSYHSTTLVLVFCSRRALELWPRSRHPFGPGIAVRVFSIGAQSRHSLHSFILEGKVYTGKILDFPSASCSLLTAYALLGIHLDYRSTAFYPAHSTARDEIWE